MGKVERKNLEETGIGRYSKRRKVWGLGTVPRESDEGGQAGQGLRTHFSEIA